MIERICSLLKVKRPSEEPGLRMASGTEVPTAGEKGYATGCIFQHTDGGAGDALYVNTGTVDSCSFTAIG